MGTVKIWKVLFLSCSLLLVAGACNLSGAPETTPTAVLDATQQALAETATQLATSGSTALPPTVLTGIAQIPTGFPTITARPFVTATRFPTALPPPTVVAGPVAAFRENASVGLAPLTVQFTNLSSGVITRLNWDFGDGQISTDFNPTHIFNAPGIFNVTLTVSGPGGASNITRQISVQSPSSPIAAFVPSVTGGALPLNVQFTNQSSGTISGLVWNFGDGTTSTLQNPSHSFTTPGVYNVTLTVTGPGGTSSASSAITAQNQSPAVQPPVAAFTQTVTSNQTGLIVRFSSLSTGVINSYIWNFGDGTTSSDLNPVHTYTTPGQFIVTLTVTGPGGQRAAQTQITVAQPPTVPPTATQIPTSTPITPTITPSWTATLTFTPTPLPTDVPTATVIPASATPLPSGVPTDVPTATLTFTPTPLPTNVPTDVPTATLTETPTPLPSGVPTDVPTATLTETPTALPTDVPTDAPTATLTETPTEIPTDVPTATLTETPTALPTETPTELPTVTPTETPTELPTATETPTELPTVTPTEIPTETPTELPTDVPTETPTETPTEIPTDVPTETPTETPTELPTVTPTETPTETPTVEAPKTGPVDAAPVIPDLSGGVLNTVQTIFNDGAARANRASVFTLGGDETADNLVPFATLGSYTLDASTQNLQGIIDWYSQTAIESGNSFNRSSIGVADTSTAQRLTLPFPGDTGPCLAGETALTCEFRLIQPAIILISVGANDAIAGTDLNTFRGYIDQAIQSARDNGVIPVLMTIAPNVAASPEQLLPYNEAIVAAAEAAQVPLINIWRAISSLPDPNQIVSPNGAGDLTEAAINTYALNARNWAILTTLDSLRTAVFPNALPSP